MLSWRDPGHRLALPPLLGQSAILEKIDSKHEIVSKDEDLMLLNDQIAKEVDTPRADE